MPDSNFLRGVDSHGIRLLPHYIRVARSGRINKEPNCSFNKTSPTTGIYDADHTYGHAAASFAMDEAIDMAVASGSGFVVVKNSTHFSASAYYALKASDQDMIGISCTNTSSMMVPTRGTRPFLGTNAITFSFPCEGESPICLDMATTQIAWNWVLKAREEGKKLDSLALMKRVEQLMSQMKQSAYCLQVCIKGMALLWLLKYYAVFCQTKPMGPM